MRVASSKAISPSGPPGLARLPPGSTKAGFPKSSTQGIMAPRKRSLDEHKEEAEDPMASFFSSRPDSKDQAKADGKGTDKGDVAETSGKDALTSMSSKAKWSGAQTAPPQEAMDTDWNNKDANGKGNGGCGKGDGKTDGKGKSLDAQHAKWGGVSKAPQPQQAVEADGKNKNGSGKGGGCGKSSDLSKGFDTGETKGKGGGCGKSSDMSKGFDTGEMKGKGGSCGKSSDKSKGFDKGGSGKTGSKAFKGDGDRQSMSSTEADDQTSKKPLTARERKRHLQTDTLGPHDAHKGIEAFKTTGTDIELRVLAERLVPREETRHKSQQCLELVRSVASTCFSNENAPVIELCGSHAQGTEIDGSAMDLALRLSPEMRPEEKDGCVSEMRKQLELQQSLEVCDTLQHFPHTASPYAIELNDAVPPLVAHVLVEDQHQRSRTIDDVVKVLCDSYKASYDLVRLVKLWAMNHNLTNQQEGFLNGVAWTMLVVFFLQTQKLILPYRRVLVPSQDVAPVETEGLRSVQFQNFFTFLERRADAPLRGISVYQGQEVDGPGPLFVQDPACFAATGSQRNLASTLGDSQWKRILEEAKKASCRIRVRPGRWFHWAEVFDPSEKKPIKITGLAAYLAGNDTAGQGAGSDRSSLGKGKGADAVDGKGAASAGKDFAGKGSSYPTKDFESKGASYGKDSDGKGSFGYGKWNGVPGGGKGGSPY